MNSAPRWSSRTLAQALMTSLLAASAWASDGSDGPFHPLSNVTLTTPADGVFHFTTITIPAPVTVRFTRNAANTPVFLTATGAVQLHGTIEVSAAGAYYELGNIAGGPGGGDGGAKGVGDSGGGTGFGLSPGLGGLTIKSAGGGGGMATAGEAAVRHSSNPPASGGGAVAFPVPLAGGSGGGGGGGNLFFGVPLEGGDGGGGGGGVRITTPSTATITGAIRANGGWGGKGYAIGPAGPGGGGSGGVVDVAADVIEIGSSALLQARGGPGGGIGSLPIWHPEFSCEADGGEGYVRLTATTRITRRTRDVEAELIEDAPIVEGPLEHFQCYKSRSSGGDLCAADSPSNAGGACATEEDCGGSSSVPTEQCLPNKLAKGIRVSLADALEPTLRIFDVKKPLALCAPADKYREGVANLESHLRSYQIGLAKGRCAAGAPANAGGGCTTEENCAGTRNVTTFCVPQPLSTTRSGIEVENQFHPVASELLIDASKPDRLLVPTHQSLAGPPSEPGRGRIDHFLCRQAKVSRGAPAFVPILGVTIADALSSGTPTYDLKKPTRLCTPVDKNGEGIVDPSTSLLCYQARRARKLCSLGAPSNPGLACSREEDCGGTRGVTTVCLAQAKHTSVDGIFLRNQLGAERIDTIKEDELCVPSMATVP